MSGRRYLVTGAYGCLGAWVVHELVHAGEDVTTFDLSTDPRRLRLLLPDEAVSRIPHVVGDISELAPLSSALEEREITNVIHLAALQVPFCRADPPLGARVNVVGTINVFEAVKGRLDRMGTTVYASSIAAFDVPVAGLPPSMSGQPATLYGVFKRANELTAQVYRQESGVPSIGLRPHSVYGLGRDQGVTSAPTVAMLAAAAGVPYAIPYGGSAQLQFAQDAARAVIAASLSERGDATVHNLPGAKVSMAEVVDAIGVAVPRARGSISFGENVLGFPEAVDASSFAALVPGFVETPLAAGVRVTVDRFELLLAEGVLLPPIGAQGVVR